MLSMTVLTDGRKEYLSKTLPTWIEAYGEIIPHKIIIDDSGSTGYRHWLTETFPDFLVVAVGKDRCGYTEAMRKVFEVVRAYDQPYNLHVEDDFVLHKPPILSDVVSILDTFPSLSQMSFMRQPWYENERRYGGVVEALEADGVKVFHQKFTNGKYWVKHNAFWTANPSVFPQWLAHRTWPEPPWSEMHFSKGLKRDKKIFGIWGNRNDWVCVEHIGEVRSGTDY